MHVLAITLTTIVSIISLEWVLRNALALHVWGKVFHLTGDAEGFLNTNSDAGAAPLLSVVVAAKDEQRNIAR